MEGVGTKPCPIKKKKKCVWIYVGHRRTDDSGESINEPWGFHKNVEISSTITQPHYFVSF